MTSRLQTSDRTARDSIYLHDSIFVRIRADTVFLERWHTRWREKEVTHTDTIQVESIRVETKEVRHVPRFYKYCAALLALVLLLFLIKVAAYIHARFR